MADLKISQLPVATTPLAGTELVPIVQGGTTDQTTVQAILTSAVPSGTANGVLYLNGSKVVTSGSALTFDGTNLKVSLPTGTPATNGFSIKLQDVGGDTNDIGFGVDASGNLWQNVAASGPGFVSYIGGSEAMRLNSTGLGIGTNNPQTKLEVAAGTGFPTARFTRSGTAAQTGALSIGMSQIGFSGSTNADAILRSDYGFGFQINAAASPLTALVIDLSGNLGLGVTPSAWSGLGSALQINWASIVTGGTSAVDLYYTSNGFWNGTAWTYIGTAAATQYLQNAAGDHRWRVAASGTAGNPISFTQAMTLDASGNLLVGTTVVPAGQRLRVAGGDVGFEGQYLYLVNANANIQLGAAQNSRITNIDSTNTLSIARTGASSIITLSTAGTERARIPAAGGMVVGTAALATNATDGFLYVPTCAGTPTGTPTTQTGTAPIVIDTTNHKLYFYSGGVWRDAGP